MNSHVRAKTLNQLLPVQCAAGDISVARIQLDSRKVAPGDLFIAIPGHSVDGREFIFDALKKGASSVLAESSGFAEDRRAEFPANVVWIEAVNRLMGQLADRFFDAPSRELRIFAVTGTNGKTTVSHLLARVCDFLDETAATVGTLGYGHPDHLIPLANTTPDVVSLHGILRTLRDQGCSVVTMEASSHGLDQGRLDEVRISTVIATNITRDHLDYHHTMEAYFQAKARIASWPGLRNLILNLDDPLVSRMAKMAQAGVRVVGFSLHGDSKAEVSLVGCEYYPQGMLLNIRVGQQDYQLNSRLMGEFNIANILAVTAALWVEGFSLDAVFAALSRVGPVLGRMECLPQLNIKLPVVVVDYAHTPDALEQVLKSLRKHCVNKRLWCVFGCGGNRDKGKRPLMGRIAETLADCVVVTTDNPRLENPDAIIKEIRSGMKTDSSASIIADRAAAIQYAIQSAAEGDVILLAGKGHENYQEIGSERFHFSDHEVAMAALQARSESYGVQP